MNRPIPLRGLSLDGGARVLEPLHARCLSRILAALTVLLLSAAGLAAQTRSRAAPEARVPVSVDIREGTWLAFDIARDGAWLALDLLGQIWLLPASGGQARALTDAVRDTADDGDPAFAADGSSIFFAGERSGHAGLWQVQVATGEVRRLTMPPTRDEQPAVAPDGRRLAFVRAVVRLEGERMRSFAGLHVLDLPGGPPRLIPVGDSGRTSVRDPAWSADGRTLYVVVPRKRVPGTPMGGPIWAVEVESGRAAAVDSSLTALAPAISPDGHRLAYAAADSAQRWQLWVRDLAGGEPRRLTDEPELTPRRIRWARDGSALFYVAGGKLRRLDLTRARVADVPFVAHVAFWRARPPLPARRFPAAGSLQPARGQLGLALAPHGRSLALLALGRLWVVPVGGPARAVAAVPVGARDLDWAPAGDRVAYSVGSWGEEDIRVTEIGSGRSYALTAMPGRELVPRWSPDGRWLAFVREPRDSAQRLVLLPADARAVADPARGRDLGEIDLGEWANGLAAARAPAWSPDGRALLVAPAPAGPFVREPFGSLRATNAELVPLEGPRRPLARTPFDASYVRWPDDTTVVFLAADRAWRARLRPETAAWDEPVALGEDAALYLSAARDGSVLYVSGDGLRLRDARGRVRRLGWPVHYRVPRPPPLVVRNARVLDGTGSPPSGLRDVVLRDGRIAAMVPAGSPARLVSAGATVLDAQGGVLMPGLADLHFHYNGPEQLRGLLYNGVTVLRDQGSDIATLAARAEGGAAGIWPAPRISFGGFQLYTDWPISDGLEQGLEPERDAGQIGRAVALLAGHGAEHMKIRTFYGWAAATRLIAAAHAAGLRTTGHCIFPLALLAAGMDAKEHVGNNCDERFDAPLHQDVLGVLKASGVAVDPTSMAYSWWQLWLDDRGLLRRPEVAPFTPAYKLDATFPAAERDPGYWVGLQGRTMLEQTRALHRAGIPLGLGTDAPELPWGAHLELERLVRAGLTPLEAVRAATLVSARILGHEQESGTVEVGKLADLIVLEPSADPTRDIRDSRRIRWVILGGRPVDREKLRSPDPERSHALLTPGAAPR